MANLSELVVESEVFSLLSKECEKIFDIRKRLPDFVFAHSFAKYAAIEYAHLYKEEFGKFLFRLSRIFQDDFVNYMALDPDSVDYYYRNYAFFGLASFKPSSLSERYVPVMFREGNVHKLLAGGNVGVFWGPSLRWGISADRISWTLACS